MLHSVALVPIDLFRPSGSTAGFLFDAALCLVGAVAIAVGAWITVPLPGSEVPMTLQTAAVVLAGGWLGRVRGTVAALGYLAMGAMGLPVFSNGSSGMAHLVGKTAGYLWGFVIAAGVVGALAEAGGDQSFGKALGISLIGKLCVLVPGVLALSAIAGLGLGTAFDVGALPVLPGALAKAILCAVLIVAARRAAERSG